MKRFNPNERVQIYRPVHEFLNLLSKELESDIEQGKFDDILIDSPTSRNQRSITKKLPDPAERLLILSLSAKEMIDKKKNDERNVLFSLSRIPQFIFPNFSKENVELYSQADIGEVLDFIKMFNMYLPQHSPRYDTKTMIVLKIEFYINSYLYFAKSMIEKRFPYANDYYEYMNFLVNEFFTILKPQLTENEKEVQNIALILKNYLDYTTIVYFLENFPEQMNKVIFILNNIKGLKLDHNERELLTDLLKDSILINRTDRDIFLNKIDF
ncbi:MAG: hypothetical protein ACTSQ4_10500 [Candidatus Heimdallarchaeaceae archaeon]